MRDDDLTREIAVIPYLPQGLSIDDVLLMSSTVLFDLGSAYPNEALAHTLAFLNISKDHFLTLVAERTGHRPDRLQPVDGDDRSNWSSHASLMQKWREIQVTHNPRLPQLLSDTEIIELFDNASYGGVLSIAGFAEIDRLCTHAQAATLRGRFQVGIIDYANGSGHSITYDGSLTVNLSESQLLTSPPGIGFNVVCDFSHSYFEFSSVQPHVALPNDVRAFGTRTVRKAA